MLIKKTIRANDDSLSVIIRAATDAIQMIKE
nr:MAG TPA: hypothetical protein [Caudoviricetes sp.]